MYNDKPLVVLPHDWMYHTKPCVCKVCGDTVYDGDKAYRTNDGCIHDECLMEYIIDEYSNDELAEALCLTVTWEVSNVQN